MAKQINQLQRRIMRRVYYMFAKRIATHSITVQISLFSLALFVFAKMVHVRSVIDNMLATELGNLPYFITGAVSQGEALTFIAIGAMTFTLLSLPFQVRSQFLPRMRMV
ncbi:hypothetical protein N8083_01560 [Candidatus Pacebacteria bacterium]|nr:hypothetical protein [Candidatus Paceibacterota bacterium]